MSVDEVRCEVAAALAEHEKTCPARSTARNGLALGAGLAALALGMAWVSYHASAVAVYASYAASVCAVVLGYKASTAAGAIFGQQSGGGPK